MDLLLRSTLNIPLRVDFLKYSEIIFCVFESEKNCVTAKTTIRIIFKAIRVFEIQTLLNTGLLIVRISEGFPRIKNAYNVLILGRSKNNESINKAVDTNLTGTSKN